jgi:hypothetical protein
LTIAAGFEVLVVFIASCGFVAFAGTVLVVPAVFAGFLTFSVVSDSFANLLCHRDTMLPLV